MIDSCDRRCYRDAVGQDMLANGMSRLMLWGPASGPMPGDGDGPQGMAR